MLDLDTMEFEAGPTTEKARGYCAAVPVDADRVLVIGGEDTGTILETTEILGAAEETRHRRH